MAAEADASTLSTSEHTDPFVPTYTDGTPINWDGNYAHIDGALYETGRYYKRTGLFQLFFKLPQPREQATPHTTIRDGFGLPRRSRPFQLCPCRALHACGRGLGVTVR